MAFAASSVKKYQTRFAKEIAILELDMVTISVSIHLWQNLMANKRVIVFTDCLMAHLFQVEEAFNCQLWLERVPSQSNPDDEPSRVSPESGCHGNLGQGCPKYWG